VRPSTRFLTALSTALATVFFGEQYSHKFCSRFSEGMSCTIASKCNGGSATMETRRPLGGAFAAPSLSPEGPCHCTISRAPVRFHVPQPRYVFNSSGVAW
jgi:hypothetical protein